MVKTNTSAAPAEKKAKAAPRTLEQRIAELQAQAEARAAKKQATARKAYDALVERYVKAEAKVEALVTEVVALADEHGFDLPPLLAAGTASDEPETTDEAEAKFELEQETVGA